MSLVRGIQSALFYYFSCTPCLQYSAKRKRQKQNERDREQRGKFEAENADVYRQPYAYHTNGYWAEEIRLGPGPPPRRVTEKKRQQRLKRLYESSVQRYHGHPIEKVNGIDPISKALASPENKAESTLPGTTVSLDAATSVPGTAIPAVRISAEDDAEADITERISRSRSATLNNAISIPVLIRETNEPSLLTSTTSPTNPSLLNHNGASSPPPTAGSSITQNTNSNTNSSVGRPENGRRQSRKKLMRMAAAAAAAASESHLPGTEFWRRYQREDEKLWGQSDSESDAGSFASTSTSSSASSKSSRGRRRRSLSLPTSSSFAAPPRQKSKSKSNKSPSKKRKSSRHRHGHKYRNPPVNDLHPPVVSSLVMRSNSHHKSSTRWMLQPPPSAHVMNGYDAPRPLRSSAADQSSNATGTPGLLTPAGASPLGSTLALAPSAASGTGAEHDALARARTPSVGRAGASSRASARGRLSRTASATANPVTPVATVSTGALGINNRERSGSRVNDEPNTTPADSTAPMAIATITPAAALEG